MQVGDWIVNDTQRPWYVRWYWWCARRLGVRDPLWSRIVSINETCVTVDRIPYLGSSTYTLNKED